MGKYGVLLRTFEANSQLRKVLWLVWRRYPSFLDCASLVTAGMVTVGCFEQGEWEEKETREEKKGWWVWMGKR